MANRKIVFGILAGLVFLELVLTGYLSYGNLNSLSGFCVVGDTNNCDNVQNSIYGNIFGVKLSYLGFVSFLVLSSVFVRDLRRRRVSGLFRGLAFAGAVFAFYLIYVQIFILGEICTTCMVADGTAILIFLTSFVGRKNAPLV